MHGGSGKLRQRVAKGDTLVFGCVTDSRSGSVIEAYEEAGYDVVMIDREHTALNHETILEHIRLCRLLNLPCMVRVAELGYAELNRTLDQLPDGVFVPRIRSRTEVERVVETVKYPPLGKRGIGASTCPAGRYLGWRSTSEQIERLNTDTVLGIQIETAEAMDDLDGILSVPGVDMAVVGNDDLSTGLGIPGQLDSERYREAVMRIIHTCRRHGVVPGIAARNAETVTYWAERGMRVFWSATDVYLLWEAAAGQCRRVKAAIGNAREGASE